MHPLHGSADGDGEIGGDKNGDNDTVGPAMRDAQERESKGRLAPGSGENQQEAGNGGDEARRVELARVNVRVAAAEAEGGVDGLEDA